MIAVRTTYYFLRRVFIAEPLFKVYCTQYGRNLHTGIYVHWVQGKGDLLLGDDVNIQGKCSFFFAARYSEKPRMLIGDHTGIGHNCSFTVGKEIRIGKYCRFGSAVAVFDAPGHPADPVARLAGLPSADNEVRPVTIGDNVWIGSGAVIFPGVTIGDGSIVATGFSGNDRRSWEYDGGGKPGAASPGTNSQRPGRYSSQILTCSSA